eukprot:scaffold83400_cov27-Prasinocladus_malaysianus.AAC.2
MHHDTITSIVGSAPTQGSKYQADLFSAAQKAMGLRTGLQPLRASKFMWTNFMRHSHGGFALREAETRKIVSYIRLWKNANNQVSIGSTTFSTHCRISDRIKGILTMALHWLFRFANMQASV